MSKNNGKWSDTDYAIAASLSIDVEQPLKRLVVLMEATAMRYIRADEQGSTLGSMEAMELAGYMEAFGAQLEFICDNVSALVDEHDKKITGE